MNIPNIIAAIRTTGATLAELSKALSAPEEPVSGVQNAPMSKAILAADRARMDRFIALWKDTAGAAEAGNQGAQVMLVEIAAACGHIIDHAESWAETLRFSARSAYALEDMMSSKHRAELLRLGWEFTDCRSAAERRTKAAREDLPLGYRLHVESDRHVPNTVPRIIWKCDDDSPDTGHWMRFLPGMDYDADTILGIKETEENLQTVQPVEPKRPVTWAEAVMDACAVWFISVDPDKDNPRAVLRNLIEMEVSAALDPAISQQAAALRDTYKPTPPPAPPVRRRPPSVPTDSQITDAVKEAGH